MRTYFGRRTQPIELSVSSNCAFGGQCTLGLTGTHKKFAGVCSRSSDRVHPGPQSWAESFAFSILALSTGALGMPPISGPAWASVRAVTVARVNATVSNWVRRFMIHPLFQERPSWKVYRQLCPGVAQVRCVSATLCAKASVRLPFNAAARS